MYTIKLIILPTSLRYKHLSFINFVDPVKWNIHFIETKPLHDPRYNYYNT